MTIRPYNPERAEEQPPLDAPAYASSAKRHPLQPLVALPHTLSEVTGPVFADRWSGPDCADLTRAGGGQAAGQRIIVAGRVLDEDARPARHTLVEIWQANAAGRYDHDGDQHDAPLDAHFHGAGSVITDEDGRYRFETIRPGAYPWRNHENAWRPAHIHFSVFGPSFATRLITQMYFPDDPLHDLDPIMASIPDAAARRRLIATYEHASSIPEYALGFAWDIVLRGRNQTPMEAA